MSGVTEPLGPVVGVISEALTDRWPRSVASWRGVSEPLGPVVGVVSEALTDPLAPVGGVVAGVTEAVRAAGSGR